MAITKTRKSMNAIQGEWEKKKERMGVGEVMWCDVEEKKKSRGEGEGEVVWGKS